MPLEGRGIFNFTFSPDGDRVALATKDGQIMVLDPRQYTMSQVTGKAHDSPRSFQIVWIDKSHLLSVGFSRGSQRKINLYRIGSDTVKTIASQLIDTSPSVLFPHYDPDTSILYLWGKGERVINAYEVHPSAANEQIAKLPGYNSGDAQLGVFWLPKLVVDVKKVEVAKVLRLTAKTMEEVSFSIPRNKVGPSLGRCPHNHSEICALIADGVQPEFFQDDIFVDTLDVETPTCTAAEWLAGTTQSMSPRISLRPEGMKPCEFPLVLRVGEIDGVCGCLA